MAKEIFWAEIYRGRLFCRAELYRGRRLFFRADRFLGAKQEGLTIVHFLNKLNTRIRRLICGLVYDK